MAMKIWGLTGSIGMGKSTVAQMLIQANIPVFDADAAVHRLQGPGGRLLPAIEARFPGTTGPNGVDRPKLGAMVFGNPVALKALEAIVHPAVAADRKRFLRRNQARAAVVLDIPLLFETRADRWLDGIIVVSAPAWKQRQRVMRRPGMTLAKFARIRGLQVPDAQKRRRATHVIATGGTFHATRRQVHALLACLRGKAGR